VAFLSPRHFVCQELCVMNGQRGTNCGGIWEPQRAKCLILLDVEARIHEEAEEIDMVTKLPKVSKNSTDS